MDNPQDQLTFLHLSEADLSRWREDPVTVLFLRHLSEVGHRRQAECIERALRSESAATAAAGAVDAITALFEDCTASRVREDYVTADSTFVDPRLKKVRKHGQTDAQ